MSETKAALEATTDTPAPASIEARFQALWVRNQDGLLAALEARRVERTKNLEKNLDELAEKEVNKIKSVMTELRRAIQAELDSKDAPQMLLDLSGDEPGKRQRENGSRGPAPSHQGNSRRNPARIRPHPLPLCQPQRPPVPGRRHLAHPSQGRT